MLTFTLDIPAITLVMFSIGVIVLLVSQWSMIRNLRRRNNIGTDHIMAYKEVRDLLENKAPEVARMDLVDAVKQLLSELDAAAQTAHNLESQRNFHAMLASNLEKTLTHIRTMFEEADMLVNGEPVSSVKSLIEQTKVRDEVISILHKNAQAAVSETDEQERQAKLEASVQAMLKDMPWAKDNQPDPEDDPEDDPENDVLIQQLFDSLQELHAADNHDAQLIDKQAVIRVIESEEVLEGPMPKKFKKFSREKIARAAVRSTKKSLIARINDLPQTPDES